MGSCTAPPAGAVQRGLEMAKKLKILKIEKMGNGALVAQKLKMDGIWRRGCPQPSPDI